MCFCVADCNVLPRESNKKRLCLYNRRDRHSLYGLVVFLMISSLIPTGI